MLLILLLTFCMASLTLYLLYPFASKFGLLDQPCARKQHNGHIPLIGGISLFLSIAFLLLLYPELILHSYIYIVSSFILVCMGVIDDRFDISVTVRLFLLIALSIWLVLYAEFKIHYLGDLIGFGKVVLSNGDLLFTVVAVIGAVTAFNMIDGLDGLLGGLSSVTLAALAVLFASNGQTNLLIFCLAFICGIVPYIICNLGFLPGGKMKVFMGDAGSLFIGFTVVWLLIESSQTHFNHTYSDKINPVTALWLIAIPLMDMVYTMLRRIQKKQSPFKADRDHIHHVFQRLGLSSRQTLALICFIATVFASIGILCELFDVPEVIMFSGFIAVFIGYFFFFNHIWKITVFLRASLLKKTITD